MINKSGVIFSSAEGGCGETGPLSQLSNQDGFCCLSASGLDTADSSTVESSNFTLWPPPGAASRAPSQAGRDSCLVTWLLGWQEQSDGSG